MLVPLQLPPGVYKNGTDYQSKGRWSDSNLVRWTDGTIRPMGGWTELSTTTTVDSPRTMHTWNDNGANSWLAVGTASKLYIYNLIGDQFDITPIGFTAGLNDSTIQTGYGNWLYGYDFYGTPRPEKAQATPASSWSLDNFGELLVGTMCYDGKVYQWDLNTANKATQVPNSPINNCGIVVTSERFLFCLGADGIRNRVKWADRETLTEWTPLATNEAGDFDLQSNGKIMCGVRVQGQTLIITTTDAHVANYIGPPYVYGFERVGTGCGIVSRNAVATNDLGAFWMGSGNFYSYTGGKVSEVPCDVSDYVFSDINTSQASKVIAVHNSKYSELMWFYPSQNSNENDRYVTYNYESNSWYNGQLGRTAGVSDGVFKNVLMAGSTGTIYRHEDGYNHDGMTPYVESGPIEIGSGDNVAHITSMIPDEQTQGSVVGYFSSQFYPNSDTYEYGPYNMANPTDMRISGRQVKVKIQGQNPGDWRLGVNRLEIKQGGKR